MKRYTIPTGGHREASHGAWVRYSAHQSAMVGLYARNFELLTRIHEQRDEMLALNALLEDRMREIAQLIHPHDLDKYRAENGGVQKAHAAFEARVANFSAKKDPAPLMLNFYPAEPLPPMTQGELDRAMANIDNALTRTNDEDR
jgi:hypothetical protein